MKNRSRPADDESEARDDDEEAGEAGDPNRSITADHRPRNSFLAEDGDVDSDDPNLSALFAETGVEERLDELGL